MLYGKKSEKLFNPTFTLEETKLGTKSTLTVLVDDGMNPPYEAYASYIISPELITLFGVMAYAHTHTALLKELCNSDLTPPDQCECKSPAWMEMHPTDKVEYRSTLDGHIYQKPHTKLCPNNPKNRSKNVRDVRWWH